MDPVPIYFTDQALPPGGHIEPHYSDESYLLRGLCSERTKSWFIWKEGEKSRAIEVAVNIEKLCYDYYIGRWWRKKVKKFREFKDYYDSKKFSGKYVDSSEDWPFDPCHPREISLPGDMGAIYTILSRFHDWMIGFDRIFCFGGAVSEFLNENPEFEQRPVHIAELEEFLKIVKRDIEENHVCRHLIENGRGRTPDEIKVIKTDEIDNKIIELYQRYDIEKEKDPDLKRPGSRKIAGRLKEARISEESHVKINNRIKRLRAAGLINNTRKNKEQTYDPQILEQMISNGRVKQVKAIE